MAVSYSKPLKHGTCYANGARTDATPGAMQLVVRTDFAEITYPVADGSHHEAAYTAAMVALVLMDAQGYNVVEVQTPNEVVVQQMKKKWGLGADNLLSPHFSLRHVCDLFNKVTFVKI